MPVALLPLLPQERDYVMLVEQRTERPGHPRGGAEKLWVVPDQTRSDAMQGAQRTDGWASQCNVYEQVQQIIRHVSVLGSDVSQRDDVFMKSIFARQLGHAVGSREPFDRMGSQQLVDHSRRGPLRKSVTRSEEHTYELQSLMRTSYAYYCLKKKSITKDYKDI